MKTIITILFFSLAVNAFAQDIPQMNGYLDYQQRGDAYTEKMAYDRALKAYEKGLEKDPGDSGLLLSAAKTSKLLGNSKSAEQYFARVISIDADPGDMLSYAEVLAENGKYEKAEEWMGNIETTGEENLLATRRKEGYEKVQLFYEDSLAYFVDEAPFNSHASDFGAIYLDEGVAFLSSRSWPTKVFTPKDGRDGSLFLDLFLFKNGELHRMEGVNDQLNQGPFAMLDDRTMIVTNNYPEAVKNSEKGQIARLRMLLYQRNEDSWELKGEFPLNDRSYSVGHPSYDPVSGYLYFSSDMPGGAGQVDLYRVKYDNGQWGTPENLVALNTAGREVFPFYEKRNRELYFSSDGYAGLGGLDIYKASGKMDRIVNPGYPMNSSNDDFGVVLDETGRKGFISSNRPGGKGKDDIYTLVVEKVRLRARIVDEQTGQQLNGEVTVRDTKTGREITSIVENGVVAFEGYEDHEYEILVNKEGYDDSAVKITAKEDNEDELTIAVRREAEEMKEEDLPAKSVFVRVSDPVQSTIYKIGNESLEVSPLDSGEISLSLNSIYFSSESSEPLMLPRLGQLVDLLEAYPFLKVTLKGSTDSWGDNQYNLWLAQKRAGQIKQEFVKAGIPEDRIKTEALGEDGVINKCADGAPCEREHHAQNRRVDLVIEK